MPFLPSGPFLGWDFTGDFTGGGPPAGTPVLNGDNAPVLNGDNSAVYVAE
jgi:hypothetical protein